jgi:hypothetical protein
MARYLWTLCFISVCFMFGSEHARASEPKIPYGIQLAVIRFRDCLIEGEIFCNGAGEKVTTIVSSALNDSPMLQAIAVLRPVGPRDELSDAAAVAYGKSKGYVYIVNGEVRDFHPTSMFTKEQRGDISVRVLRTSDGQVVDAYSCQARLSSLGSLNMMVKGMATDMRYSLEANDSFIRRFLFGTRCNAS